MRKKTKKVIIGSPVVEQTPIVWKGQLLVVEAWQSHWEGKPAAENLHCVRIRNDETGEILSTCMNGYGYSSAFVWEDKIYVFAAKKHVEGQVDTISSNVYMSETANLKDWSEPKVVLHQNAEEQIFNQSVCYDGNRFVMAYESLSNEYKSFTEKFAESEDLVNWKKIDGAVFGEDRYTACPAIRYSDGYYYMLYLEKPLHKWFFQTYIARSNDLKEWELSDLNPVLTPDSEIRVHPDCVHGDNDYDRDCTANGYEVNASDPDLVEWQGKTRLYFTGGCQHWGGFSQYIEFDGPMSDFFKCYF